MLNGKFRPEKMVRKKMPDGSSMIAKMPQRRRDQGGGVPTEVGTRLAGVCEQNFLDYRRRDCYAVPLHANRCPTSQLFSTSIGSTFSRVGSTTT